MWSGEIRAIPLDQPLAARLAEAAAAMDGYFTRMGAVLGALHATGGRPRHRGPLAGATRDRSAATQQTRDAVAELFEPDRESLRLPPDQLATIFVSVVFAHRRAAPGDAPAIADVLDVFLHGALR